MREPLWSPDRGRLVLLGNQSLLCAAKNYISSTTCAHSHSFLFLCRLQVPFLQAPTFKTLLPKKKKTIKKLEFTHWNFNDVRNSVQLLKMSVEIVVEFCSVTLSVQTELNNYKWYTIKIPRKKQKIPAAAQYIDLMLYMCNVIFFFWYQLNITGFLWRCWSVQHFRFCLIEPGKAWIVNDHQKTQLP